MPDELAGERLDLIVARFSGSSRAAAGELVSQGRVLVQGRPAPGSQRIESGLLVEVSLPTPEPAPMAEPIPVTARYEDADLAVVDKPPGLVVHPGAGIKRGTLAGGLVARWPELERVGDRWGIVHRLDRDTSGLLLVAKNEAALVGLRRQLADRRIEREYEALAHGRFEFPTGTIDAPIGRDRSRPTRMAVISTGRQARTHYSIVEAWAQPPLSRMIVRLETGRTHQIRVHFAAIGHALVGDVTYGRPGPPGCDPGRVWLHARKLKFSHPRSGGVVEVWSPLPADLQASLSSLGLPFERASTQTSAGPGLG